MNDDLSEMISQYYREYFKREPDKVGLDHYITEIKSGRLRLEDIPIIFENSEEFKILKHMEEMKLGPITTVDGITMYLNSSDGIVSYVLFMNKVWEPFETFLVKSFLKSNSIFVDIGAHVGYYSLIASSIAKNGKVFSFEPEIENYNILEKNVRVNNFSNIQLYNHAVSDKNKVVNLYLSKTYNTGDNRLFDDDFDGMSGKHKSVKVKSVSLDNFLNNHLKADIIKMDIQGSEMLALKGMRKLLRRTEKLVVFTEFWPRGILATRESPEEFLNILSEEGFMIYEIDEERKKVNKKSTQQLLKAYLGTDPMAQTNLLCTKNISLPHLPK